MQQCYTELSNMPRHINDVLRPHGFKLEGVREETAGARAFAVGALPRASAPAASLSFRRSASVSDRRPG